MNPSDTTHIIALAFAEERGSEPRTRPDLAAASCPELSRGMP